MKRFRKGFTLIELLVVIAIIGVLSAVVLSALNSARAKGANATVKATMNNLRGQMEVYYDDPTLGNGTYGANGTDAVADNCVSTAASIFANAKIRAMITAAEAAGLGTATCAAHPLANASNYVVSIQMKAAEPNGNTWWCIDSSGVARSHTNPIIAGQTACP